MNGHRYRWGGLAWLLTLQFFVVEGIAAARFPGYSYSRDVISDLGTALSPARTLMNASFVAQGVLIAAGALLLTPALSGLGAKVARALLLVAGLGVLVVGLVHSDSNETVHDVAAGAYLLGGAIGVIALAYGLRPRSEGFGTLLAVLGLIGVVGTIFFAAAVFLVLGEGGMERVAAYVLPVALAVTGAALWRQGDWSARPAGGGASRQEQREAERMERARVAAERDAALEAAARRSAEQRAGTAPPAPATGGAGEPDDEPDDFDPDDPWTTRRR
ncbi:DUF998 domain-containing protein [Modestobacter sp. NPDC049651]|uniref:DUF998 domain-containing protein n=1 Tax=unclassified Modestobacter TaxID=2643866 RepID=UPI0033D01FA5